MRLLNGELDLVAKLARELCGIVLDETKDYLIENRLSSLALDSGCKNYTDLCALIASNPDAALGQSFVDQITTGESRFFRDGHPFDAMQHKIFPEAMEQALKSGGPLRILSAACSAGQEPMSLAMVAIELFGLQACGKVEIVGIDISESSLKQAESGTYSDLDLGRSERPDLTSKWFRNEQGRWQADAALSNLITYQQANIIAGIPHLGSFDVIFCRNVAIYFDQGDREKLFSSIRAALKPHGVLVIGSSEQPPSSTDFASEEHCRSVLYRRI